MTGYALIVGPGLPVDHSATFDYSRAITEESRTGTAPERGRGDHPRQAEKSTPK